MQKTKTIQIRSPVVHAQEQPVRVIWDLINNARPKRLPVCLPLPGPAPPACPELTQDVLLELYHSEV